MLNINDVARECIREVESVNIPHGKINSITVNTRAKSRWGQCTKKTNGYDISISSELMGENTLKGLKETIIHELIHTCMGCMNHGAVWKAYADRINRAYGYNIKRASTAEEKGLTNYVQEKKDYKYMVQCDKCGAKCFYQRRSKVIDNIDSYRCKCGGHLKVSGL